jgi:ribose transport system permease protein
MNSVSTTAPAAEKTRPPFDFANAFRRYGTILIFVVIVAGASYQSATFLTERNIMNVLRQVSGTGIMSIGMLFVILTAGIDLSGGSISAFGSVLSAMWVLQYAPGLAIPMVIAVGAGCGLLSGVMIAYLRMPAFVMTLAVMTMARGMALIVSKGQPILVGDRGAALSHFAQGFLFGIPYPVVLMFAIFIVAGIVLNLTRFGRLVKAIGSNPEAVRLSGVNVPRHVLSVYVISGALAAIAGIISTGRSGVGSPIVGVGAELEAIAATVIGGASLAGGRGGAFNTLLGAVILGVIGNIMNLADVPGYSQQVFMGVIITVAVLLQQGTQWMRRT